MAERHEIAAQHAEWEIIGPPEIRDVSADARYFHPYPIVRHAELLRLQEPAPQMNPHLEQPPAIGGFERNLVALFLRRYVTHCARRRHFARMQSAAALHQQIVTG